ncbi:biotin--[acetyl-CoA-carboxylase] ligase [Nocardia arizonensis]|uniref:biotin--[acetyl-CoA-carboxylase] ligase n=1 Tax=Nocardia arizonensis TaxID=1141647 RepID=UPI001EF573C0|nr:biotin--[acetyl-CoA-carboxylase] ligase [Nocardia arizonensis]
MRREVAASLPLFGAIDVVESTGSTNADLVARATASPRDTGVLVAEAQEAGRGRHARNWVSPPRAQISMSMLVRPHGIDPAALGWLPLLTGIAVVDALRGTAGVDAKLKWPNDVLIGGRKVAGILAEVAAGPPAPAIVVGVGVNVSMTEAELPVPHAISLALAQASTLDRTELILALLTEFARRFTAWRETGWAVDDLAAAYRAHCATLGARVRAELPGGEVLTGVASDVDEHGRLIVGDRALSAGDVTHLRAEY